MAGVALKLVMVGGLPTVTVALAVAVPNELVAVNVYVVFADPVNGTPANRNSMTARIGILSSSVNFPTILAASFLCALSSIANFPAPVFKAQSLRPPAAYL